MIVDGATAIVTGAASGIGLALVNRLSALGCARLILIDLDAHGLAQAAAKATGAKVDVHVADLADASRMETIFGGLDAAGVEPDFLFNNAGIPAGTPGFPETGLQRIKAILDVNLLGLVYATRLTVPLMRRKGGSILNTASTSGLRPYLSGAVYAASKAGVIMFTQSCKDLAAAHGVRVNAVCPGMVDTPFLSKTGKDGKIADWLVERVKAGAALSADAVAEAAVTLACDDDAAGVYRVIEATPPTTKP